jgi:hypothetical protein
MKSEKSHASPSYSCHWSGAREFRCFSSLLPTTRCDATGAEPNSLSSQNNKGWKEEGGLCRP